LNVNAASPSIPSSIGKWNTYVYSFNILLKNSLIFIFISRLVIHLDLNSTLQNQPLAIYYFI
jgi:hypothetical protein